MKLSDAPAPRRPFPAFSENVRCDENPCEMGAFGVLHFPVVSACVYPSHVFVWVGVWVSRWRKAGGDIRQDDNGKTDARTADAAGRRSGDQARATC